MGSEPFLSAASFDDIRFLQALSKHDPKIYKTDMYGNTAFILASEAGHFEVVNFF
ncbi:MAG TPA: ankyrin repeat domain-containing protein, partial [Sulfurimonas sp.]|nr:ankyrin repeat domain-containing protein [Sulfurimonas sp.]